MRGRAPADLRVNVVEVAGVRYVVLSYAVSTPAVSSLLTEAEQDVLALLLWGLSNAEIALQRRTAVRTVANQIASIFQKLGVSSRSELAAALASGG
jgi:DNA-binding NarL/FixJ family response regulator